MWPLNGQYVPLAPIRRAVGPLDPDDDFEEVAVRVQRGVSSQSRRQGRITRAGNRYLRHILVQAAPNARYAPSVGGELKQRVNGVPADLVNLSLAAQTRLHHRYLHLDRRIGRLKAVTAVGRELAGFVWAIGRRMEATDA